MWSRHGSTRYLWKDESLEAACRYVREGQGGELPKEVLASSLSDLGGPLPDGRGWESSGWGHRADREARASASGVEARSPIASGFWAFADAGRQLSDLHLNYEQLEPYPLQFLETPGMPLSYRVEDKMRLSKDKSAVSVNPTLTLAGIPPEAFNYRLGNRSALEWVIDQYQVSTDQRSGIRSDPNRPDDQEYIVRLVGQVVRVSVETVRIVADLPKDFS